MPYVWPYESGDPGFDADRKLVEILNWLMGLDFGAHPPAYAEQKRFVAMGATVACWEHELEKLDGWPVWNAEQHREALRRAHRFSIEMPDGPPDEVAWDNLIQELEHTGGGGGVPDDVVNVRKLIDLFYDNWKAISKELTPRERGAWEEWLKRHRGRR